MSSDARHSFPRIDPFEQARTKFLDTLTTEERALYDSASPRKLFYEASNRHRRHSDESKLRACTQKLQPLVTKLQRYGDALDILSSVSTISVAMAPLWGSIHVVITAVQTANDYFEQVVEMFEKIGDVLPQFEVFKEIFPDNAALMLAISEGLSKILVFCHKAKEHYRERESSMKARVFRKVRCKSLNEVVPNFLEDFEQSFNRVRTNAEVAHYKEAEAYHRQQREELALQLARSREQRLKDALLTLSRVNYKSQHAELQRMRHTGTGEWLIKEPSFKSWMMKPTSGCFYCFGIPGAGKSVLASTLVESLSEDYSSPENLLGYYFCDYQNQSSLNCSTMVATLIRQILFDRSPRPESLVQWILDNVDEFGPKPTSGDLTDALKSVFEARQQVFLVLDGLDELNQSQQDEFRNFTKEIISLENRTVKVFISCRPGIAKLSDDIYAIESFTISSVHNRNDIRRFVEANVEEMVTETKSNPGLKRDITDALSSRAEEMFLWVKFQLLELRECSHEAEIRDALEDLPEGLADTYARILERIFRSTAGKCNLEAARDAFQWIVCAIRPLHIEELFEALAIQENDTYLHRDRIRTDIEKFLRSCGNLIAVQSDGIVRLAHHTVQQFLLKKPDKSTSSRSQYIQGQDYVQFFHKEADKMLGRLCIAYLYLEDFELQVATRKQNRLKVPLEVLQPVNANHDGLMNRAFSRIQGYSVCDTLQNESILITVPEFKNMEQNNKLNAEFHLLDYVRSNWAFHIEGFQSSYTWERHRNRIAQIALDREYAFQTRPWRVSEYVKTLKLEHRVNNDRVQTNRLMFYWALENRAFYLHSVLDSEPIMDFGPDEDKLVVKGRLSTHLDQIVSYELSYDTAHQSLFLQKAASWGVYQISKALSILSRHTGTPRDKIISIPFDMFYKIIATSSNEVRSFLAETIRNVESSSGLRLAIAFDEPNSNVWQQLTADSQRWYLQNWKEPSRDPRKIFSKIFVKAFIHDLDIMAWAFKMEEGICEGEGFREMLEGAMADSEKIEAFAKWLTLMQNDFEANEAASIFIRENFRALVGLMGELNQGYPQWARTRNLDLANLAFKISIHLSKFSN